MYSVIDGAAFFIRVSGFFPEAKPRTKKCKSIKITRTQTVSGFHTARSSSAKEREFLTKNSMFCCLFFCYFIFSFSSIKKTFTRSHLLFHQVINQLHVFQLARSPKPSRVSHKFHKSTVLFPVIFFLTFFQRVIYRSFLP